MPCYSPLSAWRSFSAEKGKKIFFGRDHLDGYESHRSIDLPCGQCIGCRLEKSRQWACRLMAEAQCHETSSFLTLTYAQMPPNCSLNLEDITLFFKRLRRHIEPRKVRYFQCGEYGEQFARPHHHCILFGEDFGADRISSKPSQSGLPQFTSRTLDDLWGHGDCTIGDVSFESAAYVARYALKKITGDASAAHYAGRKPEFITMSRRPGLGATWLERYKSDVYPGDVFVPGDGRPPSLPPKAFDRLLERSDPQLFDRVKRARERADSQDRRKAGLIPGQDFLVPSPVHPDSYPSRLMTRGEVKQRVITDKLKRGIE